MSNSNDNDGTSGQKSRNIREWIGFAVSILTLVAVGIYTWITYLQYGLGQDTERRQLRAYLFADASTDRDDFRINAPIKAVVTVKHSGQTPAFAVRVETNAQLASLPQSAEGLLGRKEDGTISSFKSALFPSESMLITIKHGLIPREAFNGIRVVGAQSALFVWGKLDYEDAFGCIHFLKFCYLFNGPEMSRAPCEEKDGKDVRTTDGNTAACSTKSTIESANG